MMFYFHLRVGALLSPDDLGLELPDLETAYLEAFRAASAMWSELLAERADPLIRSFEIADAKGRHLLTLPFREVLEAARNRAPPIGDAVRSATTLLRNTKALASALQEQIETTRTTIEATQRSIRQAHEVLDCNRTLKRL